MSTYFEKSQHPDRKEEGGGGGGASWDTQIFLKTFRGGGKKDWENFY